MKVKTFLKVVLILTIAGLLILSCKARQTINIGAIFAVTGPASYLGAPEEKTAQMLVDEINAKGGVEGKLIRLIVKDSQGSTEKAVSFAKQLIEEEKVVAIIGPSTSGESLKLKELCEEAKVPLISCAAAESIVKPVAKYVFKTPQSDSLAVRKIYEDMKKKGYKRIAAVASNTGFGNGGLEQLKKLAPEYGIEIVISETYDKAATDLTSILTKVNAKKVDAVVNWSIEPAQSIIAKNMKQLKMTAQLYQSHGFGNIKYVEAAGEAAEGIIFPCGRLFVAEKLPDTEPTKAVLVEYAKNYREKFKEEPSTFGGHAYDALMLVVEAIKKSKSLDRDKIRDALENIKNFAGTAGVFNFSPEDHNGLDITAFAMFIVKNGKFEIYE